MWYEVSISSEITVGIEANSKQEAQDKAQNAIWFDSDVEDAIKENMEVQTVAELQDEDDAEMCTVKLED